MLWWITRRILGGWTAGDVVSHLNSVEEPDAQGQPWTTETLTATLSSKGVEGCLPRHVQGAQWLHLVQERILDEATAQRVRHRIQDTAWRRNVRGYSALLRGLVVCGSCGAEMAVTGEATMPTYACLGRSTRDCGPVNAERVDDQVATQLVGRLTRMGARQEVWSPSPEAKAVIAEVDEFLRRSERAISLLDESFFIKPRRMSREAYVGRRIGLEARRAEALARRRRTGLPDAGGERVAEEWNALTVGQQREALYDAVADATVLGQADRLTVSWTI